MTARLTGPITGPDFARAAQALVGCPFRLHGRDPATGLDCIGLLESAMIACGLSASLPVGYTLRTGTWRGLAEIAAGLGFAEQTGELVAGDVVLFQPSPMQLHFAVVTPDGACLIEAHAGLRRVVISPLSGSHPPIGQWRLTSPP